MSLVWSLNGLSYLAVALLAFHIFFSFSKKSGTVNKVGNAIGVNGMFSLLFAFLNFSWVFNFLNPANEDFVLMNFVLTVISSVLILYIVYKITGSKNLIYLLLLFLITIFAINFSMKTFFFFSMSVSYLLMVLVFLNLLIFSNFYLKIAGFFGLVYSSISIFFLFFTSLNFVFFDFLWFIPNILMFVVFYTIFLDIKKLGICKQFYKIPDIHTFGKHICAVKHSRFA